MSVPNPWVDLPKRKPYVLPMDRDAVEAYGRTRRVLKDPEALGLHTELLPVPFQGHPNARVVLLSLNPGFSEWDEADHQDREFWEAASRNLTHTARGKAFFSIDPQFKATAAYRWWAGKLRWLIEDVGLESVADGLFCLEAYPYHSRKFRFAKSTNVPSQAYTRSLLLERIADGALIVGMRARRHWETDVPELRSYGAVHWLSSPQNASLSPRNLDYYDDIVSALKHR